MRSHLTATTYVSPSHPYSLHHSVSSPPISHHRRRHCLFCSLYSQNPSTEKQLDRRETPNHQTRVMGTTFVYVIFGGGVVVGYAGIEFSKRGIAPGVLTQGFSKDLLLATKLITLASTLAPTMFYARKVFDEIPQRDVFLWNILIKGYADSGPCMEALLLYKDMHLSGLLPDHYTFSFVVRSCAVLSALKEGEEVHRNAIKNGCLRSVVLLFLQDILLH